MKKSDVEHWHKIKEGQPRRDERRELEDPAYMEKQRAAARAQYRRLKDSGQLTLYHELEQRSIEKYGVAKKRISALEYYKKCARLTPNLGLK